MPPVSAAARRKYLREWEKGVLAATRRLKHLRGELELELCAAADHGVLELACVCNLNEAQRARMTHATRALMTAVLGVYRERPRRPEPRPRARNTVGRGPGAQLLQ